MTLAIGDAPASNVIISHADETVRNHQIIRHQHNAERTRHMLRTERVVVLEIHPLVVGRTDVPRRLREDHEVAPRTQTIEPDRMGITLRVLVRNELLLVGGVLGTVVVVVLSVHCESPDGKLVIIRVRLTYRLPVTL